MIPLSAPTKVVQSSFSHGIFVIEGLYPGYGVTIGNSLRRVLLSSLEGAAVTQVKMKGVEHEFSTMPGIHEDVISILLAIKQMRFRIFGEGAQKGVLKQKGEKEVRAGDFDLPASLELVNGDLPLLHLTQKSAEIEIEIQVEKGTGYVPAEEREKTRKEIGTIALDAIFTPIRRVSSKVENMRVGDRTDFNRLVIEIETDGTITPEEAFYQATDILLKEFQVVMAGIKEVAELKMTKTSAPVLVQKAQKIKKETTKAKAIKKAKK